MSVLRHIPIRRALNRPNLLLGAERELILLVGLITAALIFITLSLPIMLIGIAIWIITSALLRMMARSDPILSKIYLRHMCYQSYYAAHSSPFVDNLSC